MKLRRTLGWVVCMVAVSLMAFPVFAQGDRGKAELKAGSGTIVVDYGRPALKGRDMLSQLAVGSTWRMGSNAATTISTPVDLAFGSTKIAKGSYALVLKRDTEDSYSIVFRPQAGDGQHGQTGSGTVASVPMKKGAASGSVEAFTLELTPAANGGTFVLTWGTTKLTADFTFAK